MIEKIKMMFAATIALILTILTLGGYAAKQKRRAEQAERENEWLMINHQAHVAHEQRTNVAIAENSKAREQAEQSIASGRRDYFEHD